MSSIATESHLADVHPACGEHLMAPIFKVFVVDDEPIIAETIAMILTRSGYSVESFTDPKQAITLAIERPPHMLISDVVMPEISGIELAISFQNMLPACKVLLLSGQAATVDLLEEARVRGRQFRLLQKPIHPTDLLRVIESVIS